MQNYKLEIIKANFTRKFNYLFLISGLILFVLSYMYLKKANVKLNSVSSTNPFAVSYADAYNSKQLDTIRNVPAGKYIAPYTLSAMPPGSIFLGVLNDTATKCSLTLNGFDSSSGNHFIFNPINPVHPENYAVNIWYRTGAAYGGAVSYKCIPSYVWEYGFTPQLYFEGGGGHFPFPSIAGFAPFPLHSTYHSNANIAAFSDYDIVFEGCPKNVKFVEQYGTYSAPPLIGSLVAPVHATQWYSNPIDISKFEPPLLGALPNPHAGNELVFGYGDQSQIPYEALNAVHVVNNSYGSSIKTFVSLSSSESVPIGARVSTSVSPKRTFFLRNSENLNDGVCISLCGVLAKSSTLSPTSYRTTWVVLNGQWTLLPTFVYFNSDLNEIPRVLQVTTSGQQVPITLQNLANRWILLSSSLQILPTIVEPSVEYLNSKLGIPLNAFGRQGITIMSSSFLAPTTLPHRTVLSVKGDTTGSCYWCVLYAAWAAGFSGQAYVSDIAPASSFPTCSTSVNLNVFNLSLPADYTRTFMYIMQSSQTSLTLPQTVNGYSFVLVIVGSNASIQVGFEGSAGYTLTSPVDTIDSSSSPFWPVASITYLVTVVGDPSLNCALWVSPPFGYSTSLLQSVL